MYYTIPGFLVFATVALSYGAYLLHEQSGTAPIPIAQQLPVNKTVVSSSSELATEEKPPTTEQSDKVNITNVAAIESLPQVTTQPAVAPASTGFTVDGDFRSSGGYLVISADIDGAHFHLDVANDNASRQRGLSFRENLAPGTGMIFVFNKPGLHGIWMKDMNFAIDILWVNTDGTVVHAETNVSPNTYPRVFMPPLPSDYVIELPAGTWQTNSTISL